MTKYRSKFEKAFAAKFKQLSYEPFKINYIREHTYTPDFVGKSGQYYFELKGFFRQGEPAKYIAIKKCNPNVTLIFVFMYPHKRMPGARKRKDGTYYTMQEWADKFGFEWCTISTVKKRWLT